MKAAPFEYVVPSSIEEACALLAEAGGGAQIIAGGQTLMPLLALRMSQPFILVDITRIAELKGITRRDGITRIGAAVRQNEALGDATLAAAQPLLVTALRHVGHHQTRNRGTVGGSVALGEPAAEMPATAVALNATVEVASVRGTRRIAARELYFGPYATALEPDELLVAIDYPAWSADARPLFREIAQRPGDFALVGLTGSITVSAGRITAAGIAWFGMGPTPMHAAQVEKAMVGQTVEGLDIPALAELALADTAPFDDLHAGAEYRRTVGRRVFSRTLSEALLTRAAA